MKPYSITRRLIVIVLLVELISAGCVTMVAFEYERRVHFRAFDVQLRGHADSMLGAVQDAEDVDDNVMLDGTEVNAPRDDIYEVMDANGRVLGRSPNWTGHGSLSEDRPAGRPSGPPFESQHIEGAGPDSKPKPWFFGLGLGWDREPGRGPDRGPGRGRPAMVDGGSEQYFRVSLDGKGYRVLALRGLRIVDPGDKGGGVRRFFTVYYGSPFDRVWDAVLSTVGFYAVSSLLVLATTGVLMAWLLSRGLAPLRELAVSAGGVSVTSWTFAPPDRARKMRELAPLVSALEELLRGLKESFERQQRFVGDAAHELKTSVAVVKSSMQLLSMKSRSAEEYQAGLDRCLADCLRMEEIVAQMLTLARVEEMTPSELEDTAVCVSACLREVAEELAPMARLHEIAVENHSAGDTAAVRMDPAQFKLVFTNLLMNAIQHSPPGTSVKIQCGIDDDWAELQVVDQGSGIDPRDLPHIFERFARADPSRSRKTGGTGLGLAIAKAVTERFGGSIGITSDVGVGTTVRVRFPLART